MFNSFRRLIAPSRNKPSVIARRAPPRLESLEERCVPATFAPGSIQGQDGWSGGTIAIAAAVDQAVVQSTPNPNAHAGVGSWRVSNSTVNGNFNGGFNGWPFSPGLAVTAGQPSSGAGADRFTATFFFKSANTVADGSNMEVDLGSSAGDDRNSFLAITNRADADGGLQLRADEPDGATGNFKPTQIIATGLSRTAYHRIDVVANFFNGNANDTFQVTLDGVVLTNPLTGGTTFGTFEGFRNGTMSPYVLTNRLFWRSGAAPSAFGAFTDNAAQGFFFDDVRYSASTQANPTVLLASYAASFEATNPPPPSFPVGAGQGGQGHVAAFNAAGAEVASFLAYPGYAGAVVVASADVNNDGVPDIITGTSQGADHVKVFDGKTGALLFSFLAFGGYTGGIDVAAGDVNHDGFADVIVGAGPGAPGGHVKVFSGATGAEIRSFFSFQGFTGGVHVGSADLDHDGFDDVIVGTATGFSHVKGFSGQTGALLASFFAFSPALPGGVDVAGGDVNGTGFAEIFASTGPGTPGLVRVFNAAGAQQLQLSPYGGFSGGVSVGAADLNGDFLAEITTGAGPGAGPHVKRFDGQTAAELNSFFAFSSAFLGGVNV
jgi:hypothetical protein